MGEAEMQGMKVQDWKIWHKPVIGKLWNCRKRKAESKPVDLTVE